MTYGRGKLIMRALLHVMRNMPGMPKDPALEKELEEAIARPPGWPGHRRINTVVPTLDAEYRSD